MGNSIKEKIINKVHKLADVFMLSWMVFMHIFIVCVILYLILVAILDYRWTNNNKYEVGDIIIHKLNNEEYIIVEEVGDKRLYRASNGKFVIDIRELEILYKKPE